MNFTTEIEKKDKSIVEAKVKMPFSAVAEKKDEAFKKLSENLEVEGFRKGHVPENILKEKISDDSVLKEAAQLVINDIFPRVLEKEELQIIGFPAINVTKLAEGNDFEFSIEMSVYPKFELPDYKKNASEIKVEEKEITEEDWKAVEKNILDMFNHQAYHEEGHEHKEGEEIPQKYTELTDELVAKMGDFKTVEEFKKQVMEDLKSETKVRAQMEKRGQIAEVILKETDFAVPGVLVNAELDKIVAQLKDDVVKKGIDWKIYLETSKKTEQDVRGEYEEEAGKRAKMEIILKEIFKKEELKINKEDVEKQVENIKSVHKDVEDENIRLYVENIMMNEEVMKFLETL